MVWGLFPVDPLSGLFPFFVFLADISSTDSRVAETLDNCATGEDKYYIFKAGIYKIGRKGTIVIHASLPLTILIMNFQECSFLFLFF